KSSSRMTTHTAFLPLFFLYPVFGILFAGAKRLFHSAAQGWQEFGFEPRIFAKPYLVARGGMHQREATVRQIFAPCAHGIAQRVFPLVAQIKFLRIAADQQG